MGFMFYFKKKDSRIPFLTEQTLAEKLTGRFDMSEKPSLLQERRFYVTFAIGIVLLFCNFAVAHSCSTVDRVEMDNGAGNTWTCSNCNSSNYCWQMSCSNCGNSQ